MASQHLLFPVRRDLHLSSRARCRIWAPAGRSRRGTPVHLLPSPESQSRVFQLACPLPARPPLVGRAPAACQRPGPRPLLANHRVQYPAPPPPPEGPQPRPAPAARPLRSGGRRGGRQARSCAVCKAGRSRLGGGAAPTSANQRCDHSHANTSTMERAHHSLLQASLKRASV